jgi:hypothetical protein
MVNHIKHQFIDVESRSLLPSLQGLICVDREVRGRLETLPLNPQWHYKEWVGCFSLLGNSKTNQGD